METRWRLINLLLILLVAATFNNCRTNECYRIAFRSVSQSELHVGDPVLIGTGIAGQVDGLKTVNGSTIVSFCIPRELPLSKNSTFSAGFIVPYGTTGVKIDLSDSEELISKDELIQGEWVDSLTLSFPKSDTLMKNMLRKVIKNLN